jgi:PhzF family phenazine biosynthesis protein
LANATPALAKLTRVNPRSLPVFRVDAFTRRRFSGNPAVVVLEADALSTPEMRMLANELHDGDTAFVLKPDGADHDLRVRFFSPTRELPFVGHATVAAHYALGLEGPPRPARVRQMTGAGIIDIEVRGVTDERTIAMTLAPPTLGRILDERDKARVLDALALSSSELDPACPLQIALKGSSRLMIGLQTVLQLDGLRPDLGALRRLSPNIGADGYFVFARQGAPDDCLTEARMFCPAIGIDEDPVSGNAHGMLGVYLAEHRLLPVSAAGAAFTGLQGRVLGRPGRVHVELSITAGRVNSVTISGAAVLVYRTTVEI